MLGKIQIPMKLKAAIYILSVLICIFSTMYWVSSLQNSLSASGRLYQIQREYPPGSKFTGAYRGASECFGFAGYVFHALYGYDMPNSYYADTWYQLDGGQHLSMIGQLVQKDISKNAVEGLLSQGKPGDIIQYGTPRYPHTMVFLEKSGGGVTVYDCNYDRQCTVMVRQVSYQGLADEIGISSPKCGLTLYRAASETQ